MLIRSSILIVVLACLLAPAPAQVTVIGGGCTPWGGVPAAPFAIGGAAPQVGNSTFSMGYGVPPFGTVACFWIVGACDTSGIVDYPASLLCGGPPCTAMIDFTAPLAVGGANAPPFTIVAPLPIPNDPQLAGVEVCIQYLAFANFVCTTVSQGAQISIQP